MHLRVRVAVSLDRQLAGAGNYGLLSRPGSRSGDGHALASFHSCEPCSNLDGVASGGRIAYPVQCAISTSVFKPRGALGKDEQPGHRRS